jgi:hypothetical protein
MARTRNPAISPLLLLGLGVGAYFVLRGGGGGGGGGGGELVGAFNARTFAGAGELFVNGTKAGDIGPVPATFTLPAGVPIVLKVKFADGSESPERSIVLQPSGPASAGGFNPQQLFTSNAIPAGEQSWAKLQADLTAQNRTEMVSAVQATADAVRLTKARQYEQAIAAYRAIDLNYPGTLQATLARVTAAAMTAQLQTTAGRAALDRDNPI